MAKAAYDVIVEVSTDGGSNYTTVNGIKAAPLNRSRMELDVTVFGDEATDTILGLFETGTELTGFWLPTDAGQIVLEDAFEDGSTVKIRLTLDLTGTDTGYTFDAKVSKFNVEQSVEGTVNLSATCKGISKATRFQPA